MLHRQDVGHRVVVRRIVDTRADRPLFSDLLGELVELTETDLTIATARGATRIPLHEVHRAKRVPPARQPGAAAIRMVELAAYQGWPAPDQAQLGDWRLRAAEGWTGRGNSALAIGDPGRPLDEAIDAVERWYAERRLPPVIAAPMPLAAEVNAALDERRWTVWPVTLVLTAPLSRVLSAAPERPDLPPVELATAPSEAWLAMVARHKGTLPPAARHILTAVPSVRFAHLYDGSGRLVAVARGTVTGGGRWLGVTVTQVAPTERRRGLAQHLLGALARWAAGTGATDAFLQVEEGNAAAVRLYRRLGFRTHHSYLTRQAPQD